MVSWCTFSSAAVQALPGELYGAGRATPLVRTCSCAKARGLSSGPSRSARTTRVGHAPWPSASMPSTYARAMSGAGGGRRRSRELRACRHLRLLPPDRGAPQSQARARRRVRARQACRWGESTRTPRAAGGRAARPAGCPQRYSPAPPRPPRPAPAPCRRWPGLQQSRAADQIGGRGGGGTAAAVTQRCAALCLLNFLLNPPPRPPPQPLCTLLSASSDWLHKHTGEDMCSWAKGWGRRPREGEWTGDIVQRSAEVQQQ